MVVRAFSRSFSPEAISFWIWAVAVPYWVAWRVADLFHLADKNSGIWWAWALLVALCGWSIMLTLQLFLKSGTAGPNGYDGRHI